MRKLDLWHSCTRRACCLNDTSGIPRLSHTVS
ncbi:hypothetical protein PpBr36_07700 [Pyricularia pennisetigena]|nr:hypothetical protein PpBr36_07700 [Pyricularia pennisetigena]TLS25979.1 hypothetical protein PpBr36_07700 [Pyricularia pennisetigena]